MSLEHAPLRQTSSKITKSTDTDYWQALIPESSAAEFLGLAVRTLQGLRYRGGGPQFVCLSARCVRYRRTDLRDWAEGKLRSSTSDRGSET